MDLPNLQQFSLSNVDHINVILGKNGCGKSYLLKKLDELLPNRDGVGRVRYVSPERGGSLSYEASIEQSLTNPNWLTGQRRKNQSENFRQQSVALFRRLELLVLRDIERRHRKPGYVPQTFDTTITQLNSLLDRVRIRRHPDQGFSIVNADDGSEAKPSDLSSGESELISLGIEFLAFVKEVEPKKANFLLVDEPDVHLHPDLQDKLAGFATSVLAKHPINLILATHSTALLGGLAQRTETKVAFMKRGDVNLTFKTVSSIDKAVLPIFGAHPLSNIFNEAPILLVEGEDDERIWQQAVRSSDGKIRVYPRDVGGITHFAEFENEVRSIIESVYDDARGFSLRDRDLNTEVIDDLGPISRMRLSCRAAENLMLTNDVLHAAGTDWEAIQNRTGRWLASNAGHQYHAEVQSFADGGFDRKDHDLKDIRNILVGLFSNKPWEVLVGRAIAQLALNGGAPGAGSLRDFLGARVCQLILGLPH